MRLRAIFCCVYFGIVPWWIYEKTKHYNGEYWGHLKLNMKQAWVWISFSETENDKKFECETNSSWFSVLKNLFAGVI